MKFLIQIRRYLILTAILFTLIFIVGLYNADKIVRFLVNNIYCGKVSYIYPQEIMVTYIKVSMLFAVMCIIPIVLLEILMFMFSALSIKEIVLYIVASIFIIILFLSGVYFSYKILVPFIIRYLKGINSVDWANDNVSVSNITNFIIQTLICMGIIFEMPIISFVLSYIGILNSKIMKKANGIIIISIFIVAAIITPPDVISQITVAIPMIVLYKLCNIIVFVVSSRRRSKCQ